MTQVLDIPLNGGQDEGTDRILLPADGTKFRLMQNCRLDRSGRVAVRPQFTITGGSISDGPQLLTNYRGRLTGLGFGLVSTYVTETSTDWTQTGPVLAFGGVKHVWQNASGAAARQFDLAYATTGLLCVAQTDDSGVVTTTVMTLDGVQISTQQFSTFGSARVIGCGVTFVLITRTSTGTMAARLLDTSSTTTFGGGTTLEATVATGTTHFDACNITGTTDFLVTYPRVAAGNIRVRRYTVALSLSATADVTPSSAIGDLAVYGQSTSVMYWAYSDGNDLKIRRLDGSLTTAAGPTTVATVAGIRAPGLYAAGAVWLAATTATNSYLYRLDSALSTGASDPAAPNVWGSTKPFPINDLSALGAVQVVGRISAGSAFSLPFYTACSYNGLFPGNVHAVWDYGVCAPLDILSASDTGGRSTVVTDGTYWYAATGIARGLELGGSVPGAVRVVRLSVVDSSFTARSAHRQCVEAGGLLYIGGGNVCTWDGATLSTASFPDVPDIISIAEDGSGSQTALATYQYIAVYEFIDAAGNTVRSFPSAAKSATLTGANDRLIPTVSTPRTAKRVGNGVTPRVVLYRANPGDSVFFRVAESSDVSALDTAATVAINDGVADATAETREILYTQSQKPIANVAPGSAQFVAAGRDRLIFGGLVDPYQVKLSQLFAPGEPPECAHPADPRFTLRLPQPCTGVAAFGDTYIAFTRDAVYAIPGAGPQRNGQGEFFAPQTLYADGGCIDWRSIVSCGAGTFFQSAAGLHVLRPGGNVEFIGAAVQDTLAAYPNINGACLCRATQQVVFACQTAAGSAGVLLIHDLQTNSWYQDSINADSVTEYSGVLAYVEHGSSTYLENASAGLGSGSSLTASLRTGSLRPFGVSGFGDLCKVQLIGTYVGDSTVEAFASYDDGKTWTSLGSKAVTTANTALGNPVSGSALAADDPQTLEWAPLGGGNVSRVALRFDVTEATDTGALRMHAIALEVQSAGGTARLNAGSKN